MKTVTIREAQRNFIVVLADVEVGQSVQITRRGNPVARLIPEPDRGNHEAGINWSDHRPIVVANPQTTNTDEVLDDLRGER